MMKLAGARAAVSLTAQVVSLTLLAGLGEMGAARADSGADGTDQLETVVVTGRHRDERARDVPVAISVLQADALTATGTFNAGQVAQLVPTLQFYSSNPRNSALTGG